MDTLTFFFVITAAVLHAFWNLYAKQSTAHKIPLLCLGEFLSGLVLLPIALMFASPPLTSGPWYLAVLATSVVHALYNICLGLAYQKGDISLVYPLARGTGIVGTAVLAFAFGIDNIHPLGLVGMITVTVGILALAFARRGQSRENNKIAGLAVIVGLIISLYSLIDKLGVQLISPLLYMALMSIVNPLMALPYLLRCHPQGLATVWRHHKRQSFTIGCMSSLTYVLILFAFQRSAASYVVALREFSIVIVSVFGMSHLKETATAAKLLGILLILMGMGFIKLA